MSMAPPAMYSLEVLDNLRSECSMRSAIQNTFGSRATPLFAMSVEDEDEDARAQLCRFAQSKGLPPG